MFTKLINKIRDYRYRKMSERLYKGYTEEDQARDMGVTVEEIRDYNASGLTWIEWYDKNYAVIVNGEEHKYSEYFRF